MYMKVLCELFFVISFTENPSIILSFKIKKEINGILKWNQDERKLFFQATKTKSHLDIEMSQGEKERKTTGT